jgi:hypothetical protein
MIVAQTPLVRCKSITTTRTSLSFRQQQFTGLDADVLNSLVTSVSSFVAGAYREFMVRLKTRAGASKKNNWVGSSVS